MGTRARVLILDDDEKQLRMLSDLLQCADGELFACSEIEAAETLVDSFPFHIVLTDLVVSELGGLEGMRLVRHVATHFPEVQVLIYSGNVDPNTINLGKMFGAKAVFHKPQDLMKLQEFVHTEIRRIAGGNPIGTPATAAFRVPTLSNILKCGRIRSLLQPIVSMEKATPPFPVFAVEALSRGPEDSVLHNPEVLFRYAGRKDMLFETDLACIQSALREAKNLDPNIVRFLNVQPRSLSHPKFDIRLLELLQQAGCAASNVVIELTEQQTILNPALLSETLGRLREHGFRIALDDYGEGMSNLHYLHDLRPDFLKIAGYFAQNLDRDERRQEILRHTVELANRLDIRTILEEVETPEILRAARDAGVEFGQGYWIKRPVPCAELPLGDKITLPGATSNRKPVPSPPAGIP